MMNTDEPDYSKPDWWSNFTGHFPGGQHRILVQALLERHEPEGKRLAINLQAFHIDLDDILQAQGFSYPAYRCLSADIDRLLREGLAAQKQTEQELAMLPIDAIEERKALCKSRDSLVAMLHNFQTGLYHELDKLVRPIYQEMREYGYTHAELTT